MSLPQRQANAAIATAGHIPGISGFRTRNHAYIVAWNAWLPLSDAVTQNVTDYNNGVRATPQAAAADLDALERDVQRDQPLRDAARNNTDFPPQRLQQAIRRDTTADSVFTATRQLRQAMQHNDIFITLANRFHFYQFTDYARTGSAKEWFAETYALYLTDPNRLNEMNRNIFLWFEAGMTFNAAWNPPAP